MAVHHAVGISCQSRLSRVNIMAHGLSTPDPSLSPTHLSIRRGRATTTHYTQKNLMVSFNTALVPSLGLCIGPACEAGLSAGMRRQRVPPQSRKKEKDTLMFVMSKNQSFAYCRCDTISTHSNMCLPGLVKIWQIGLQISCRE